jgi:hypothetical protein
LRNQEPDDASLTPGSCVRRPVPATRSRSRPPSGYRRFAGETGSARMPPSPGEMIRGESAGRWHAERGGALPPFHRWPNYRRTSRNLGKRSGLARRHSEFCRISTATGLRRLRASFAAYPFLPGVSVHMAEGRLPPPRAASPRPGPHHPAQDRITLPLLPGPSLTKWTFCVKSAPSPTHIPLPS